MRSAAALVVLASVGCNCGGPRVPDVPPEPPVDPHIHVQTKVVTAQQLAPEVMLLVDTSTAAGPQLGALRTTLTAFLQSHVKTALWGLTVFPGAESPACSSASFGVLAAIPDLGNTNLHIEDQTAEVIAKVGTITSSGGDRDVAAAVRSAARMNPSRENFVLLITSGDDACGESLVDAVGALRPSFVRTVVVSFNPAGTLLDEAASAGGFSRACPNGVDAECGPGNSCDLPARLCVHSTFVARDAAELGEVLDQLGQNAQGDGICRYALEVQPSRPERLMVLIDAVETPSGPDTWELASGMVRFQGALCDRLNESATWAPVKVELRIDDRP